MPSLLLVRLLKFHLKFSVCDWIVVEWFDGRTFQSYFQSSCLYVLQPKLVLT